MAQLTEIDGPQIINNALKYLIPRDYGIYVTDNNLSINDFYRHEKKTGGIIIVVYNKGLFEEQTNQFTVICIHRKFHRIVWGNTQGVILNCQAYAVLSNLKHKADERFYECTQVRYKCEKNELLSNMSFMFYLVEMFSNNIKFGEIPSDNDIITRYTSIIPREFVQSVYSDMNPA